MVIIVTYHQATEAEAHNWAPPKAFVDARNRILRIERGTGVAHRPIAAAGPQEGRS